MNEQSKVYANSANTVFFDQNFNLITQIHDAGEWNAHDLNQYGTGDFLGVTTGKTQTNKKGETTRLEVEIPYFHWIKEESSFFGKRTLPRRIKSSVRLWVNIEDVKSELTLSRFFTNRFAKAMTMLRIAGETLLAKSSRFSWLATRLRIVRYS